MDERRQIELGGGESQPVHSVVIPLYNAECWISESIESVIAQTTSDWELIVVNDGSTDRSAEIAARYSDPRIRIIHQPNAGQSAAQNRGISASRGQFLLLLDADDRLRPSGLEHLHKALNRCPGCCLAYGIGAYIAEQSTGRTKDRLPSLSRKPSGNVLRHILKRNFVGNAGVVLIRKEAILRVGGPDSSIVMNQDWEFFCRLATVGAFMFAGSGVVLEYRIRSGSIARTAGSHLEAQRGAIEAVFGNPFIRGQLPLSVLDRLLRLRWSEAAIYSAEELLRADQMKLARAELRKALRLAPFSWRANLLYLASLVPKLPRFVEHHLGKFRE